MAEKMRHVLRLSIIVFFVLAIFFFLMIFLLGVARKHGLKNDVEEKVPIQQYDSGTWGEIPGDLGFSWNRSYKLYEFASTPSASEIDLKTVGEYAFDIQRSYHNAAWYPQKSVVQYNETFVFDPPSTAESPLVLPGDPTMSTLNMGAQDVWYQMQNKPKHFKAWQAIAQSFNVMMDSDLINRMYAYNALYYFFTDFSQVQLFVLPKFTEAEQNTIYNDPEFGMNTIQGLNQWMGAVSSKTDPSTSDQAKLIQAYFAGKETDPIDISPDKMALIVNTGSMMSQVYFQVSDRIKLAPALDIKGSVTFEQVVPAQWGFCGLTADADINLLGVPALYSIATLNEDIPFAPEFAAYVLDPNRAASTEENTFNLQWSKYDYKQTIDTSLHDGNTFLSQESMYNFYQAYETENMSTMSNHFNFTSWNQVELFHEYLDEMIDHFLCQNTTYDVIALSSLMSKNLEATYGYLADNLPMAVASQVLANNIKLAGTTCETYFLAANVPQELTDTDCAMVDFTNPMDLQQFMDISWYEASVMKGPYWVALQTKFNLTDMEMYGLVYHGSAFITMQETALAEISVQYGCASATNCTGAELGALQWGSLGVTTNPKDTWTEYYMPNQRSTAMWGQPSWTPFGSLETVNEYPQSTASAEADQTTISYALAQILVSDDYVARGLGTFFNWQSFMVAYQMDDTVKLDKYQAAWGSTFDISAFVTNFRKNIESLFFGGAFTDMKVNQMLDGYENDIAAKINGGNYFSGNTYDLSSLTTPIRTEVIGPLVDYGMYTGSNGVDEIGRLRIINDAAYANRKAQINNGTELLDYPQKAPELSKSQAQLSDVSAGMQFPPGISTDDQLRRYDARNIKVMTYTHSESQTLGSNELRLEKFEGTNHGDSIGFSYNLPVFEKAKGCYGCVMNPKDTTTIKVDGEDYTLASSDSDNFLIVQPDSGYTYQVKKESTVFMVIGGNTTYEEYQKTCTPFPSLDSIYGTAFPLYDYSEELIANDDTFTSKFSYVSDSQNSIRGGTIAMSVLAAFFLILGIVAITIYKVKDPKRGIDDREEVLVDGNHADFLED